MAIRHFVRVFGFSTAVLLLLSSQAEAAPANKIGDVLNNVITSFSTFPNILAAAAYLLGLFYAVSGVFRFKDHVDNPVHNPISAGVKRMLAGGAFLSLPWTATSIKSVVTKGGPALTSGNHTAPGGGMEKMIYDLVQNMYGPATNVLSAFAYIAAIIFLLVAINRLTKTAQEGPRGPAGLGTIMTFLVSGALFAVGDMVGYFCDTLFGNRVLKSRASLDFLSSSPSQADIESVVGAVMVFIMLIGSIAFVRGLFVLRAFAEGGNGNATLAQALTFLFGGALAINMGALVNIIQTTLGITSGFSFN